MGLTPPSSPPPPLSQPILILGFYLLFRYPPPLRSKIFFYFLFPILSTSPSKDKASTLRSRSSLLSTLFSMFLPDAPLAASVSVTRRTGTSCPYDFTPPREGLESLDFETAKLGLRNLKESGNLFKINFTGGEPFAEAELLGNLVKYARQELGLITSVSTDGCLLSSGWFEEFGEYLCILGVRIGGW